MKRAHGPVPFIVHCITETSDRAKYRVIARTPDEARRLAVKHDPNIVMFLKVKIDRSGEGG